MKISICNVTINYFCELDINNYLDGTIIITGDFNPNYQDHQL